MRKYLLIHFYYLDICIYRGLLILLQFLLLLPPPRDLSLDEGRV